MKTFRELMPALNRIILINTHMSGIVELKLNGHTNICGTNASGKTTLQRLIPVFYGEYPSRVVPATRDSFERWYLPTECSYIIYEYFRDNDETCQVVLSSGGTGVDFRLIAKGFDIEDYAKASLTDERHVIPPKELSRDIKRQGIICSRILNTKEYKAIIQNDRSVLSTNRDLPGLARLFSLCEQNANLRHIEKLAKAVHSKEGKMETIKAMVAAILEEDGVQPGETKLSHNKVEEWIRECKLIKGFEDIRPEFSKLEQAHFEYGENNQRLAQLKQQYSLDLSKVAQTIAENEALLEEVILTIKQSEATWSEQRDSLNQTLSSAKADSRKLESELDAVEQQYDDWQDKNIDELSQNLENLPRWKNELETNESRYTLLTEKHQDIEASFHKRKSEVQEQHNQELEGYNEQKDDARDQLSSKNAEQQTQLLNTQQKYKDQIAATNVDYQNQQHELKNQITEINTLANNVGFTNQEQNQVDIFEHTIKEASSIEDSCRDRLRQANNELSQAKTARDKANKELEQTRKQFAEQQIRVEQTEQLLYPGQNTLLEFLRREKSGWEFELGKVIHPDLLKRTDLHPSLANADDKSLFGILLELGSVPQPDYAESEHELKSRLEQEQEKLSNIIVAQDVAEAKLVETNKTVRNAEMLQTKISTELNNAELSRKRAQQDKDDTLKEFHQALQERKQGYTSKLAKLKSDSQKLTLLQQEAIEELQDQQREAEMELSSHWQLVINDIQQQLAQVETHIAQCRSSLKQELSKLDNWLKDELANRGVDVDVIGQLKRDITKLKQDIQTTEKNSHFVAEFKHWYNTYYMGHKVKWQEQLADVRKQVSDTTRELEKQQTTYKQNVELAKSKQIRFEKSLKEANEHEFELTNISKQLAKIKLPTAEVNQDNSSISQRINEGQTRLAKREELTADIKAYVEHFDQKIAAQSGTGFYDTWEHSRAECSVVNEQGIRSLDHIRLVGHLDRFINELVPQRVNGIREQGRIFGLALSEYYKLLKDIEGHIGGQSKRISKEVDEELFLDGVSESAVKIRSKISELEFWPELQQFNQLYTDWISEGAHDLPGDDYAYSMRRVMDILGRSALTGGISKLLDIELHIKEGNSDLVIRTDRQLNESSSHGMAYLILCKFLLAFTRLLRGNSKTVIHWPIDELGTLHQSNIKKIFDACQNNNIHVVGAFPNPESEVLTLFENRYLIDKNKKQLQVVQPKVSAITKLLKSKSSGAESTDAKQVDTTQGAGA
jgi:chromosome segregation ATPase